MLTKKDLDLLEQRITKPLREEIRSVDQKLSSQIQSVDQKLSNRIQSLDQKLTSQIKSLKKSLKRDISKVKKDTTYTVNFLDRTQLQLGDRVEKIEKHLGLPTPQPIL